VFDGNNYIWHATAAATGPGAGAAIEDESENLLLPSQKD